MFHFFFFFCPAFHSLLQIKIGEPRELESGSTSQPRDLQANEVVPIEVVVVQHNEQQQPGLLAHVFFEGKCQKILLLFLAEEVSFEEVVVVRPMEAPRDAEFDEALKGGDDEPESSSAPSVRAPFFSCCLKQPN